MDYATIYSDVPIAIYNALDSSYTVYDITLSSYMLILT